MDLCVSELAVKFIDIDNQTFKLCNRILLYFKLTPDVIVNSFFFCFFFSISSSIYSQFIWLLIWVLMKNRRPTDYFMLGKGRRERGIVGLHLGKTICWNWMEYFYVILIWMYTNVGLAYRQNHCVVSTEVSVWVTNEADDRIFRLIWTFQIVIWKGLFLKRDT